MWQREQDMRATRIGAREAKGPRKGIRREDVAALLRLLVLRVRVLYLRVGRASDRRRRRGVWYGMRCIANNIGRPGPDSFA